MLLNNRIKQNESSIDFDERTSAIDIFRLQIGVVQYFPEATINVGQNESGTDNEASDYEDPGREFVERNRYERMKRVADNTRDELDKVLKRVDNVREFFIRQKSFRYLNRFSRQCKLMNPLFDRR